jgi:hypothetical protein
MSAVSKYFTAAPVPPTAAGFADDNFAVVDLRRLRRQFAIASSAASQLPAGLVTPGFDSPNVADAAELAALAVRTAEAAGLTNKKRWSISLPDSTARSLVIQLESKPSSRTELREILEWKVERVIAVPPSQLRISRQKISSTGGTSERYLVSVARDDVIAQYESVFESIGWKAGLLLPRHVGEAQWLLMDGTPGDKLLVSTNRSGFTSLITRNGEPLLVRTIVCDRSSRGDELHRFAMYYRDRLNDNGAGQPPNLSRILVLGDFAVGEARRALFDALDAEPAIMSPGEFGFDLAGEAISFEQLAGAAGLATLAWQ